MGTVSLAFDESEHFGAVESTKKIGVRALSDFVIVDEPLRNFSR